MGRGLNKFVQDDSPDLKSQEVIDETKMIEGRIGNKLNSLIETFPVGKKKTRKMKVAKEGTKSGNGFIAIESDSVATGSIEQAPKVLKNIGMDADVYFELFDEDGTPIEISVNPTTSFDNLQIDSSEIGSFKKVEDLESILPEGKFMYLEELQNKLLEM